MNRLSDSDMRQIVTRLPRDVVELLKTDPRLFVAGGFIRSVIAGEQVNDVDVWGCDDTTLDVAARLLKEQRSDARLHKSENAITVLSQGRLPIQFITRWTFRTLEEVVQSFDFTVCAAAIRYNRGTGLWQSACHESFYPDLAARRLNYCFPQRIEDCGGSMLRVIKYVRRGYNIQVLSLAGVISRLIGGVDNIQSLTDEAMRARVIGGKLREVDPLLVVDGIELVTEDEHASAPKGDEP